MELFSKILLISLRTAEVSNVTSVCTHLIYPTSLHSVQIRSVVPYSSVSLHQEKSPVFSVVLYFIDDLSCMMKKGIKSNDQQLKWLMVLEISRQTSWEPFSIWTDPLVDLCVAIIDQSVWITFYLIGFAWFFVLVSIRPRRGVVQNPSWNMNKPGDQLN